MIREKEYIALMARLNDPQNASLKEKVALIPNGYGLAFHLNRIMAYVSNDKAPNSVKTELLELDYSVSLIAAKKLMDEQGWK